MLFRSNFDAFDISHAGEGEGFQSHGYGHYVAFNRETGESYAWNNAFDHLDKEGLISPELNNILRNDEFDSYEQMVERYDALLKDRQQKAKDELEQARREEPGDTALINGLQHDYEQMMSYRPLADLLEGTRYLYTVNIPEDTGDNYIDEMKTLSKEGRRRIAAVVREISAEKLDRTLHGPNWLPQGFQTLANVIEREQYAGLEIRRRLEDALGNTNAARKEVSEILHKAGFVGMTYDGRSDGQCAVIFSNEDLNISNKERFRIREAEPPTKTGTGYKVFFLGKDGKLYPPMVANADGAPTLTGLWLDAEEGAAAAPSKTGRRKVKAGGKGTQGGSGTLAYRPGWHLGKIPYALQFNRGEKVDNPLGITNQNGEIIKVGKYFPKDFVWAEEIGRAHV